MSDDEITTAHGFTFTTCVKHRGPAWRAPDGEMFCAECEAEAERLTAALASVARPPVFQSLRSALLGTTAKSPPVMVPGT